MDGIAWQERNATKWEEKRFNFASNHIEMYMNINPKNDFLPNFVIYYTETTIYHDNNVYRFSFYVEILMFIPC